jgi:hypothetical protein
VIAVIGIDMAQKVPFASQTGAFAKRLGRLSAGTLTPSGHAAIL